MNKVKRHSVWPAALALAMLCGGGFAVEMGTPAVTPLESAKDEVKVASVQMTIPEGWFPEHDAVDALIPYIARAGQEGMDLVVFPEYVLGYFKIPGMVTDKLRRVAKEHNVNVIVGGWEVLPGHELKFPPDPHTYANCALVVSRDGEIAGKHWKMHAAVAANSPYFWPPEPGEQGENTMVLGQESGVVDLDFGRVGLLTCYDGYFFPSFEMPSLRGAEILVWINGRGGSIEDYITRTASFITSTHLVTCNQSVGAGSMVCAWPGTILDIAAEPGEAYISATLPMAQLRDNRRNNRMLHQRRPEAYGAITKAWAPWEAYPDLPFFTYPEQEEEAGENLPVPDDAQVTQAAERLAQGSGTKDAPAPAAPPEESPAPEAAPERQMLHVALLQMLPDGANQQANLEKADAFCRQAAGQGADLALFPEMFNIGYTGYHGGDEAKFAWQNQAVAADSAWVNHFKALARELDMAIGVTYLQRWPEAPRNSLTLIDRHGKELFTYAKVHTCDFANFEAATTPGEDWYVETLDTKSGPVEVGAIICYDREFPEAARINMLKGAEIMLTPNACLLDDIRLNQYQARALTNSIAVFMTNYPAPLHGGRSVAYGPAGDTLCLAPGEEGIYMAAVDVDGLRFYRKNSIWGNAFRRPHRYGLLLDRRVDDVFKRNNAFGEPFIAEER